ncbi:uncharacterized protein BDR25DRAFT_366821 [Lindgomyces ingoldianus]|uniref:Uncharacterized protein n=1 Tax=Lindgomyces ingoldianus TaxID=673940 RepID=A0ACB6QYH1_9PLEO|nr:uncharacterized protein BDR25DRAFT_366821 [Lindgomyces ingoldianus]KAF2472068.1 hypothetical protein BDR25DRAFT_366821 [Lindgomyces ingoldianus]
MLIPSESDFDLAAQKLVEAGFRPALWSYGIIDPHLLPGLPTRRSTVRLGDFEACTGEILCTFVRQGGGEVGVRILHILLRSTYVCLTPPNDLLSMQRFYCDKNLYYPDKALLLESFIRTLL